MKTGLLLCVLFLFCGSLHAQEQKGIEQFIGHWKGRLEWNRPGKPAQQFSMRLNIQKKDSVYTWQINYGDSGKDIRSYTLRPVTVATGHWVIDENNGIVLDNYLIANCLSGSFTVMGSTIVNNYCIENNRMNVEFISMKLTDKKTTGLGTEESPAVDSYRITGHQQGWLQKQ